MVRRTHYPDDKWAPHPSPLCRTERTGDDMSGLWGEVTCLDCRAVDRNPVPAEVFPPGEYLREELAERAMTQAELAEKIGRSESVVSRIINGRADITPEVAILLGEALNTSAEMWVNLEAQYRLHLARARR